MAFRSCTEAERRLASLVDGTKGEGGLLLTSHNLILVVLFVMPNPGIITAVWNGNMIHQSYVPTKAFKSPVKGITTAQLVYHKACGFVLGSQKLTKCYLGSSAKYSIRVLSSWFFGFCHRMQCSIEIRDVCLLGSCRSSVLFMSQWP